MSNQKKGVEPKRPTSQSTPTGQSGNKSGSQSTESDAVHSDAQHASDTQDADKNSNHGVPERTSKSSASSDDSTTGAPTPEPRPSSDKRSSAANAGGHALKTDHKASAQSQNTTSTDSGAAAGPPNKTQNSASGPRAGATPPNNSTSGRHGKKSWWPPRGNKTILAVVALIVALIALGLVIWLITSRQGQLDGLRNQAASLKQHVSQLADQSDQQSRRLKTIARHERHHAKTLATTRHQLNAVKKRNKHNTKSLTSIQNQLSAIKKRNQRLANEISGSQRSWQLRRIRALLLSANQAAQLQNNPKVALAALKLADQRVATLSDPNLLGLRKELAKEMGALRAVPTPDRAGIALKLSDASNRVDNLPLAQGVPKRFVSSGKSGKSTGNASAGSSGTSSGPSTQTNSKTAHNSGWAAHLKSAGLRALHTVGHSLGQLVTVRHSNNPPPQLMPPDRAAYLTQNIKLDLNNAQAAILQRQAKLYKKNLASALKWLKQYFDTSNSKVAGLINELRDLQNKNVKQHMPDISASLSTVNQLISKQTTAHSGSDGQHNGPSKPNSDAAGQ